MRVIRLRQNPAIYTCHAYLIRGEWNTIEDVNTLIDIGTDGYIIDEVEKINTGFGKVKIEKVILTHNHFDHIGGLKAVIEQYHPGVFAALRMDGFVSKTLNHMEEIRLGDSWFTVLHTPGHSIDSICLYSKKDGVLFSGDTTIQIRTGGGSYTKEYVHSLELLCELDIKIIYPGHGDPIDHNPKDILKSTLEIVINSQIIH